MGKKREALLKDEWLSPKLLAILTEVFKRFDKSCSGSWDAEEIQDYARACNDDAPFDEDEMQQIQTYFAADTDGNLTLSGFLQMYHVQTSSRPEDTLADLSALGYDAKRLTPQDTTESGVVEITCDQAPADEELSRRLQVQCNISMALILQERHEDALRVARAALALGPSCAAAPALRQHIRNALRGLGREDGEDGVEPVETSPPMPTVTTDTASTVAAADAEVLAADNGVDAGTATPEAAAPKTAAPEAAAPEMAAPELAAEPEHGTVRVQGEMDLQKMLATLKPRLRDGEYVFVSVARGVTATELAATAIMSFTEEEGITLVVPADSALPDGVPCSGRQCMITLDVHSDLEAVGLTAVFAKRLTDADLSCNVVAGFYHDHLFVSADKGQAALHALEQLSAEAQAATSA